MADKFILGFPISEKTALSELYQDGSNIGIGTDSPDANIHIVGGDGVVASMSNQSSNSNKGARYMGGAYTGNLATFALIDGINGDNDITIGGGTGVGEPATSIRFNIGSAGATGAGTERMRIDSSGNVCIGTQTINATYLPKLQITGTTNDGTQGVLIASYLPTLTFQDQSGGATIGQIQQDQTGLVFKNNASERMRILSSGGITFNGDTATANALDDYEEGSWTPSFSDATNVTSLAKEGDAVYTKIGRVVHLAMEVSCDFTSSTAESYFAFTIPFSAYSNTFDNVGTATFYIGSGADRFGMGSVFLGQISDSKTFVYIPARELQQSGSVGHMRISLTYFAS